MIYKWNKEMKRQGSSKRSSNRKQIMNQIDDVSTQEARVVSSNSNSITSKQMVKIAKKVDDLYHTFPSEMYESYHKIYEKELVKKIKSHLKS